MNTFFGGRRNFHAVKITALALTVLGLSGCDGATITIEPIAANSSVSVSSLEVALPIASASSLTAGASSNYPMLSSASSSVNPTDIKLIRTFYPDWNFDIADIAVDAEAGHAYIIDNDLHFIFKVNIVNGDVLAELPLPFPAGAVAFSKQAGVVVPPNFSTR